MYWNDGRPDFTKPDPQESVSRARQAVGTDVNHAFDDQMATVVGMRHSKVPQQLLQMDAPVTLHRERDNVHDANAIRIDSSTCRTKIGYICKEHAALLTPWLDRDLLRVDSAMITRIDKDNNGKIVALGIRMEGSACDAAMDIFKPF